MFSKLLYYCYKKVNFSISTNYDKFLLGGGIIGNGCEIFPDVEFGSEPYLIHIGNHVRITNGVRFVTHDGGLWTLRELGLKDADCFGPITIGDNVYIGWNAIIMPNVQIGNNCVIGAGAVVTKSIPDNSVVAGVPAKVIETIDEYTEKVKKKCDYTKSMSWKSKKEYLYKKYSQNLDNN